LKKISNNLLDLMCPLQASLLDLRFTAMHWATAI
jgi:hypothetical protein